MRLTKVTFQIPSLIYFDIPRPSDSRHLWPGSKTFCLGSLSRDLKKVKSFSSSPFSYSAFFSFPHPQPTSPTKAKNTLTYYHCFIKLIIGLCCASERTYCGNAHAFSSGERSMKRKKREKTATRRSKTFLCSSILSALFPPLSTAFKKKASDGGVEEENETKSSWAIIFTSHFRRRKRTTHYTHQHPARVACEESNWELIKYSFFWNTFSKSFVSLRRKNVFSFHGASTLTARKQGKTEAFAFCADA